MKKLLDAPKKLMRAARTLKVRAHCAVPSMMCLWKTSFYNRNKVVF